MMWSQWGSANRRRAAAGMLLAASTVSVAGAQAQRPVASVTTEGVLLHNVMSVANGRASVANNGQIAALDKPAEVSLARGGSLLVCASTALNIARDNSVKAAAIPGAAANSNGAGLMFSLDRGAFETDYQAAVYSDVVLTPDLRMLISGPGVARLKLRVNEQGDTCVDNSGANAPYVVVSSLMDGGIYRVRPGQRVLFVNGSLNKVVDNESESCGCPAPQPAPKVASAGRHVGGPSSTPADTAFPTAVSEGLAPPPGLASTPAVPPGVPHAEVAATLSSTAPLGPPPPAPGTAGPATTATPSAKPPHGGFFHRIGRFFKRVFGAE